MLKNKNGGFVMSWVVTVFTMFFLLLVFFIFFFLIDLDKNKITQEIQTETQENQIHINLLNFLRTPVNEEENVGDYVGYALIEDDGIEGDYDGHLNSHYNYVINLFNQILLNHYKNAFEESSQAKDN